MVTRRPPGYPSGRRRTAAEPLTASWHPDPPELEAPPRERRGRREGPLSTYGWRVYGVPLLALITIVVLLNTGSPTGNPTTTAAPPVATEQPILPTYSITTGTGVLPPGPNVPQAGAGTWHIVPGSGPVTGRGARLVRYQVAVEDGIDPAAYGGDDAFTQGVAATLADPRSWIAAGTIAIQRVDGADPNPDFVVSLTTPNTDHRPDLCGFDTKFETSCWRPASHRVIINLARWVRGALAFGGDLGLYRQFAINHEVGHVFGNPDVGCATSGGLAPVMMQQTFGLADDYVHDLNQLDPAARNTVRRDGNTCRANAWPYPQGPGNPAG